MSLGLLAEDSQQPFRTGCYTQNMQRPATPADFTQGFVYAPRQSGHPEFSLFGEERLRTVRDAGSGAASGRRHAADPGGHAGGVLLPPSRGRRCDRPGPCAPVRTPLQAMRLITRYCYPTGERFTMSCIGIRGVSCDMTAWPYVHNDINGTFLCLGARAITGWEEQFVGFGMPLHKFEEAVIGMEKSRRGFPYDKFPKLEQIATEPPRQDHAL